MKAVSFDKTLVKTRHWLDELAASLGWTDPERCYHVLKAVLHALRDRLVVAEAVDLGAQLPMLVRGFYYEGWRPAGKPRRYRHKEPFLDQVRKAAPWLPDDEIELAVTAVFALLTREVGGGEITQIRRALPAPLRELWPQPRM